MHVATIEAPSAVAAWKRANIFVQALSMLQIADIPDVYPISLSRVLPIRYSDLHSLVDTLKGCLSKTTK